MRVVGGRFRGRELKAPRGLRTRPTAGRVREAVFSLLGDLEGERVLDLFAGSGALGIEALSRGAGEVVFVERDPQAVAALASNLARLGIGKDQGRILRADALAALRKARNRGWKYDLVLIDPPYAEGWRWEQPLRELLPAVLAGDGRAVVECDRQAPLTLGRDPVTERRYGNTLIRIYLREDMTEMKESRHGKEGEG